MNDLYDMNHVTRQKVKAHAKENGYPAPSVTLIPITTALIRAHRLSLICDEIDATTDRLLLLKERIADAIREGNLVALLLLKERQDAEKDKLVVYGRMLDKENPMRKGNDEMDRQIANAREYPMEELLTSYGCVVKFRRTRCPVHEGKNPSSFEVKDNRGRCHSCSWTGDSIDLVMRMDGCTFVEAVRKLQ